MWVEELSKICKIYPSTAYKFDETPKHIAPKPSDKIAVVKPKDKFEVSKILKFAYDRCVPVYVRGGGTGLSGGAIPTREGIVLSTEKLNKILIDKKNRIAECEAGVTLFELKRESEKSGLSFPPHPGAETATIGGMIATNAGGVRALKYGTIRNYVLGIEVVLSDGKIVNFGSKTLKNSSGYSLLNLFIGSEGTLGVITKAYIKLYHKLEEMVTLAIPFTRLDDALGCVPEIMYKITPMALEFIEGRAIKFGEMASGKKWPRSYEKAHLMLILERRSELDEIEKIVFKRNAVDIFVAESKKEQRNLLEIRSSIYLGLKDKIIEILDVCVPPGSILKYIKKSDKISDEYGIELVTYGHAGDGNLHQHPLIFEDWEEVYFEFREKLFRTALDFGGVISGEHGIGSVKLEDLKKLQPEVFELMKSIKKIFDPKGILNPGKVVD